MKPKLEILANNRIVNSSDIGKNNFLILLSLYFGISHHVFSGISSHRICMYASPDAGMIAYLYGVMNVS